MNTSGRDGDPKAQVARPIHTLLSNPDYTPKRPGGDYSPADLPTHPHFRGVRAPPIRGRGLRRPLSHRFLRKNEKRKTVFSQLTALALFIFRFSFFQRRTDLTPTSRRPRIDLSPASPYLPVTRQKTPRRKNGNAGRTRRAKNGKTPREEKGKTTRGRK